MLTRYYRDLPGVGRGAKGWLVALAAVLTDVDPDATLLVMPNYELMQMVSEELTVTVILSENDYGLGKASVMQIINLCTAENNTRYHCNAQLSIYTQREWVELVKSEDEMATEFLREGVKVAFAKENCVKCAC